jgi:hypothetical protein
MSDILNLPKDERASFGSDTRKLRLYLIGSLCLVVSYRLFMVVEAAIADWWHTRAAHQTISGWWK